MNNGYDAWGNPQFQHQQPYHQNAVFTPTPYQPQPQPQQHPQQHPHPYNAHPQQQQQQQHQPQNANYQFHSYDPSLDQRPTAIQPSPQNGVNLHTMPHPPQHTTPQRQYVQQQEWQHMPPPMSMSMPSPSYQSSPQPQMTPMTPIPPPSIPHPQHQPPHQHHQQQQHQPQFQYQHQQQFSQQHQQQHQQQQHQQYQRQYQTPVHRHVSSPVAVQSPQLPPQFVPHPSNRHISTAARIDPRASPISASPRLGTHGITRSPSVGSARSPAPTPGLVPHHADTNSLLICIAEEYFSKARESTVSMVENIDAQSLNEYQKLVATGLGCLEAVLESPKLQPRLEARIRFRYASILSEETNNVMEAETALTKGITLCERNRFTDLKYAMHFLQIKLLFSQQKVKAAMIAVDGRIRDAEVVKHYHWIYAFRFLKTSMYLQSANPAETHALDNLKAIANLANQRNDHAISVVASLLEGLSLLKTMKDDAIVRVQACIAQALKYQFEDSVRIPQLDALALMLDLACSLHQKSVQVIMQKLKNLQDHMDTYMNDNSWHPIESQLLLPIRNSPTLTISHDTAAILRPGPDGGFYDYLVMSFWSKLEAYNVTYTYSGLALLYQSPRNDKRIFRLWEEAMSQLQKSGVRLRGLPNSLADAVAKADWQREWMCYLYILQGLHFATHTRWPEVKKCVAKLEDMVKPPLGAIVVLYSTYLAGVYHQGTGDLKTANSIFGNPIFSLDNDSGRSGNRKAAEVDVALLATFNRIWIMQHPDYRNDRLTLELLEQLRPLCSDHPNVEIRTSYNLVLAAVQTNPPVPMTAVKMHISTALNSAQSLGNVHTLSIALNVMRAKLFQNIVGDQALKSAKAASNQAKRSGNTLWMSVADGMLAQSFDVQGQGAEAQRAWGDATQYAQQTFNMMGQEGST
ncbi:cohesin loading factor-domain-containing protein [Daldinia eschscholtzii]|nr:cohesin loading factor-domain-containing protein [Daldinia eschscholtzii]